jgi:selenocysteine-specific translation elongation factor
MYRMPYTGNVTAILGGDIASALGKKGTSSDITLYNHKQHDCILSFVQPTNYPDKIQSLVTAITMADQVLLKIDQLNSVLAETIVTLNALDAKKGYLIPGENKTIESLKPLTKDSVVSGYSQLEWQPALIREKLAEHTINAGGQPTVLIDHSFPVKGVGTVALGVVKCGTIKKHDELTVYPSRTKTLVKSIQVHDTDVAEAQAGIRVGLALKDIKPEELPRGTVISLNPNIKTANTLELNITLSKYSPRELKLGDTLLASAHLNYTPAKILEGQLKPGETGKIHIQLEKEIPLLPGRLTLLDPSQKMPRTCAGGQIPT